MAAANRPQSKKIVDPTTEKLALEWDSYFARLEAAIAANAAAIDALTVLVGGIVIPVGGITTIASGSLPAAAIQNITDIPATFVYLVLQITGASSNTAARAIQVLLSTNNGSSFDTTVANYPGYNITTLTGGATIVVDTLPTIGDTGAGVAAAATTTGTYLLFGYQAGPHKRFSSRILAGGTEYLSEGTYIGSALAINAMQIGWSGSGNFDAGTYALYGVS